MQTIKMFFTGLIAASVSIAAISGKVTDISGKAISGALVQLEGGGQTTTSGEDGSFTLSTSIAINSGKNNQSLSQKLSATMHNGLLHVDMTEKSTVDISTFDLHGKVLSRMRQIMDAGFHSIALSHQEVGIYLYKVKSGCNEIVLKSNSIDGFARNSCIGSGFISNNVLSKQAKVTTAINDVIAVAKKGYLNYRVVVYNSDMSGVAIKMIDCADTMRDIDGNLYQAVRIGNQVWTVENLRVTKYRDGSDIPFDTSTSTWKDATTPKFCYYSNTTSADSIKKFGALYNWYVVSSTNLKKIAPSGWHAPSDAEWDTLLNYLVANGYNWNGVTTDNRIAKSMAAKADWQSYTMIGSVGNDLTKNNRSGFSALPGGIRGSSGDFINQGSHSFWWSATVLGVDFGYSRALSYSADFLKSDRSTRVSYHKNSGFSVRLVRD